jgi:anthranilate synthase component 1
MNLNTFIQFAHQGYNRIPVYREVLADLETPLSSYLKLARGSYSYLFESVQGGEKWGRYSFIGLPCRTVLKVIGNDVIVERDGEVISSETHNDPLFAIEKFQQQFKVPDVAALPRFNGGLVGYFGYDTVRYVESHLQKSMPKDELHTPDIVLMVSEEVLVFDNLAGKLLIIVHVDPSHAHAYEQAQQRLDALEQQLRAPLDATVEKSIGHIHIHKDAANQKPSHEPNFKSGFTQEKFEAAINRIKEYILAGDIMQVVLSQRLSIPFHAEPLNLYRALRNLNPSPYMYFLNMGDFHIVGSSPEILARLEDGIITVRPIAGTRRRGYTPEEDKALEEELLADPKEIAEHLMLIDLGRNDVGRVSEVGTVKLTEKMIVERFSHVMHITSNVTGKLREYLKAMDVLRATLPAGTLSGAPKVRAMEIIDELEPVKRGIYGGAVGYLSWKGNMDTAIAIRTAVIKNQTLYVQAGGGIVADSQVALEWKEAMNKARAMFKAVSMVSDEQAPGSQVKGGGQ